MRTVVFESFEILDVGPFSLERNEEPVGGHLWSKVMVDLGQIHESKNLSVSSHLVPALGLACVSGGPPCQRPDL